jgi:hypothetical protein
MPKALCQMPKHQPIAEHLPIAIPSEAKDLAVCRQWLRYKQEPGFLAALGMTIYWAVSWTR